MTVLAAVLLLYAAGVVLVLGLIARRAMADRAAEPKPLDDRPAAEIEALARTILGHRWTDPPGGSS